MNRARPFLLPLAVAAVALVVLYKTRIDRTMPDFDALRAAAGHAIHGQPLYETQSSAQFVQMPIVALLFAPFSRFQADTARVIWFALSIGLLVSLLRWSVRGLPERNLSEPLLLGLAAAAMASVSGQALIVGQTHFLLAGLLVAALLIIQIDLPRAGAVLIGLAAWFEPCSLVLLPWIGFTQGVAAAGIAVLTFAIGLLAPVVTYGWSGNLAQLLAWSHVGTGSLAAVAHGDISIAALWTRWIGPGTLATVIALLTIIDAIAAAGIVWTKRWRIHAPEYLEFAQLLILIPLFSPQGRADTLVLATPAAVCLIDRWKLQERAWRWLGVLSLAVMSIPLILMPARAFSGRVSVTTMTTVAALALFSTLCRMRWKGVA